MKLRVNWSRFLMLFVMFQTVLLMTGCSGAWLSAVSALLPALSGAVSAALAFVLSLEGKTVPASVTAAVQKIVADIQAQIANVQQLIADYKAAASAGILAQIEAVFQGISADLASILQDFNVTDSATVSKFTALIGLAVAAAQAIIGLLPLVTAALSSGATKEVLEAQDKEAAAHIQNAHKGLQSAYVLIRTTPTASADVNGALTALPKSLP
jgi:hypothetical protein